MSDYQYSTDIPRMNTDPQHMVLPFKEFCKTIVAVRLWCPVAGRLMRRRAAKNVPFPVIETHFSHRFQLNRAITDRKYIDAAVWSS